MDIRLVATVRKGVIWHALTVIGDSHWVRVKDRMGLVLIGTDLLDDRTAASHSMDKRTPSLPATLSHPNALTLSPCALSCALPLVHVSPLLRPDL